MLLDHVLERNRSFVAGRSPVPLPPVRPFELAVVACYDPRLDPLLLPALGLKPAEAFLFRSAGALVRPGGQTLRSLCMSVFMFDVTEILVLGHAACRMATFETPRFIEAFRARGVSRDAFGPSDLRDWAGAIPSPRRGVEISVAAILEAPFLPPDVSVSGAVLDEVSGAIEVIVRPGERPRVVTPAAIEGLTPRPSTEEAEPPSKPATADVSHEPREPEDEEPEPVDPLVEAALHFVDTLAGQVKWRHEVHSLRENLGQNRGVVAKFRFLEKTAERIGADSRTVAESFERLKREARSAGAKDKETIVRILQRIWSPS